MCRDAGIGCIFKRQSAFGGSQIREKNSRNCVTVLPRLPSFQARNVKLPYGTQNLAHPSGAGRSRRRSQYVLMFLDRGFCQGNRGFVMDSVSSDSPTSAALSERRPTRPRDVMVCWTALGSGIVFLGPAESRDERRCSLTQNDPTLADAFHGSSERSREAKTLPLSRDCPSGRERRDRSLGWQL